MAATFRPEGEVWMMSTVSSAAGRWWRHRRLLVGAVVGVTVVALAGCSPEVIAATTGLPQAVVVVPGSVAFSGVVWNGPGNPTGTSVVCTTTRQIVVIRYLVVDPRVTVWGKVVWPGQPNQPYLPTYPNDLSGVNGGAPWSVAAFGPVDPGCGEFTGWAAYDDAPSPGEPAYTGPSTITFDLTSCDPTASLQACVASAPQ